MNFLSFISNFIGIPKRLETIERLLRQERKIQHTQFSSISSSLNNNLRIRLALDFALQIKNNHPLASEWLDLHNYGIASQHGEDGVLLEILKHYNLLSGNAAEIGAGDNGGNTGILCYLNTFSTTLVEQSSAHCEILRNTFLSPNTKILNSKIDSSNVNELLPEKYNILSIDIDSYDYWVLKALKNWPDVLVVEYNATFGLNNFVVKEDYDYTNRSIRDKQHQIYGASLVAYTNLAKMHNLELIYCERSGTNAFFVSNQLIPKVLAKTPEEVFRASSKSLMFVKRDLDFKKFIENGDILNLDII